MLKKKCTFALDFQKEVIESDDFAILPFVLIRSRGHSLSGSQVKAALHVPDYKQATNGMRKGACRMVCPLPRSIGRVVSLTQYEL